MKILVANKESMSKLTTYLSSAAAVVALSVSMTTTAAAWTITSTGMIDSGYDATGVFGANFTDLKGMWFSNSITLDPTAFGSLTSTADVYEAKGLFAGTATNTITVGNVTKTFTWDIPSGGNITLVAFNTNYGAGGSNYDQVLHLHQGLTADGSYLRSEMDLYSFANSIGISPSFNQSWTRTLQTGDIGYSSFSIAGNSGNAFFDTEISTISINAPLPSIPSGGSVLDPIMPTSGGGFRFIVGAGRPVFIDPVVAVGYDYTLGSGPNIQSVLLPNIGDGLFDLFLWDTALGDYVFSQQLTQGISYDFGVGGVDRFRIMGIETSAGLDPNNPNAFVTGLTFTSSGIVDMNMTPHTFDTDAVKSPVPEPETYAMLLAGLGLLGFTARRRKQST